MTSKFVLHDDELVESHNSLKPIISFELEDSNSLQAISSKQQGGKADVFGAQDKDIQSFEGFYAPIHKQILYYSLGICTGGILFLISKWAPKVHIALSLSRCQLRDAEYVRITLIDGRIDLERVVVVSSSRRIAGYKPTVHDEEHITPMLQTAGLQRQHMVEYRCNRYFYVDASNAFLPVLDVPKGFNQQLQRSAVQLAETQNPLLLEDHTWEVSDRQMHYGANEMRIPVKSLGTLIHNEMWHPFYVFQYFSIFIWIVGDQYYTYSVCILLITWFSIITTAVEAHRNMKRLAGIAYYQCSMQVLRGGEFISVASPELVPGDVVIVAPGVLPADMVLLSGECIVDENMLTGESVPVRKIAYSPETDGLSYSPDKSAAVTLYGGTAVAQARAPKGQQALAMVCRTRFYSAKGQLLRSILFPKEHSDSFISDSLKFIAVMLTACIGLFIWAAVVLASIGAHPGRMVVRFFDMVTVAVPPALPACLTIATVFSVGRLKKKEIFVTGPDTITVAGQLDVICFDKTGTLTEQGLELQGVLPITNAAFQPMTKAMEQLPLTLPVLLASCHGLAQMGEVLVGDPLDQKLFAASGWSLHDGDVHAADGHVDGAANGTAAVVVNPLLQQGAAHAVQTWVTPPGAPDRAHAIIRRFEFSSQLQRNLVVVQQPGGSAGQPGSHLVCAKGSPEMIRTLVQQESIPADFDRVLGQYTREGLRVLALAAAEVSHLPDSALQTYSQEQLESAVALQLVGLAVMANPLRPDTAGVIDTLLKAQIRCAMVTGDHLRTAVSVAHQCGLLPTGRPVLLVDGRPGADTNAAAPGVRLSVLYPDGSVNDHVQNSVVVPEVLMGDLECAVTGKGFDQLLLNPDADIIQPVLRRGSVFARMSPDNKRDLMLLLGNGMETAPACAHLSLHVGFCGDGANDCGALKAAHVGLSLCEAEASVAAPMTSRRQTIASMVTVVAEGRCTLVATYQIFQFIVGYAMAQAFSVNLMYTYALQLGNYQFLIQDLFYTTVCAALMGYTQPAKTLARSKPVSRVLSLPLMMATVLQIAVIIIIQTAALRALYRIPGYTPTLGTPDLKTVLALETTVIYLIGLSQFVILALIFNKGYPHRQPIWTNWGLSIALVLQCGFIVYSLFSVDLFTQKVEELVGKDKGFNDKVRASLLVLMVLNVGLAFLAEVLSHGLVWLWEKLRDKWQARREASIAQRSLQSLLRGGTPRDAASAHNGQGLLSETLGIHIGAPGAYAGSRLGGAAQNSGVPNGIHMPQLQRPPVRAVHDSSALL